MRLRKKPWIKDEIAKYDRLVVQDPKSYAGRWADWFGEAKPLHVEIGMGKGNFITSLAEKYPDIHFIGIEVHEEVLISAVRKAQLKELKNIAFLWLNVNKIEEMFGNQEIDRIYLNFSDPWPKTKHAKRRLTHSSFLQKYKPLLKIGAEIHQKTDNERLFEFSLNEFCNNGFRLKNITFDLHQSTFEDAKSVMTEYEQKFVQLGMKIFRLEAKNSE
jgi:tRNA (guanine-N7-)-methyltransferase